ncbi:hypothetical protein Csa_019804 [Cucumis sativus]|nr:hypothetical protein Csa_019804 [Cucumis sativus]
MHPSISLFPNSKFYSSQISDGPNVKAKAYEKTFLPGPMFDSYSFININGAREEKDEIGHSLKNMVEVDVVLKIVHSLSQACVDSKGKMSIGVVSPYSAQVVTIQRKIGKKYNCNGFNVKDRPSGFCRVIKEQMSHLQELGTVCGYWETSKHCQRVTRFGKSWLWMPRIMAVSSMLMPMP